MAFGFGRLRLSPAAFWAMTPREIAAVLNALQPSTSQTLQRHALDELLRRFPDT